MPSSTTLNTRISVPLGQGRAAIASVAWREPSDPSTASNTFSPAPAAAAGSRTSATEHGAKRRTALRHAAQEESFHGAQAVRAEHDQVRVHGRGVIQDHGLGIALRHGAFRLQSVRQQMLGGDVRRLPRACFNFLSDRSECPRLEESRLRSELRPANRQARGAPRLDRRRLDWRTRHPPRAECSCVHYRKIRCRGAAVRSDAADEPGAAIKPAR